MTKKCLISLFVAIIFALPLAFANATIPFEDNFESYTPGISLNGQGGWTIFPGGGGTNSVWWVNDNTSFTKTGSRSLYYSPDINFPPGSYQGFIERTGATTTNTTLQFFYKFFGTCNNNSAFGFYLAKLPDFQGGFCASYNATTSEYVRYDRFSDSNWHKFQMDFNWEVAGEICRWRVDSENWTSYGPSTFPHYVGTLAFEIVGSIPAGCYIFIDDVSYRSSEFASISPTSPPDCQATAGTNFNPLEVSGKIDIPINSKRTFTNLIVRFQEATTTISMYDFSFALPNLIAGQTYDYFATGTIPTSTYRVSYILSGYDENLNPFTQSESCPGTFSCGDTCNPAIVSELPGYEQPTQEDCDIFSGIDKVLCQFKNMIAGAVVPSTSTIGELKTNLDQLQDKAPMNYLKETQNFFTDLRSQSSTTNSLPLTLLGQEGNVSFAFWEKTGEINGVSFSFRTIFYNFFSFVVIIILGFWGLGYLKRIFK